MHREKIDLGDELCKWCSIEKKGAYGVDGGFMAGCEGSGCDLAYEAYLKECAEGVFFGNKEEKQ
jgi:hypothetical protein